MGKKTVRKRFKRYRRLSRDIHKQFCDDPQWCNYGKKPPKEMRRSDGLEWPEMQRRAKLRLGWYQHCQASLDAENIAARHT